MIKKISNCWLVLGIIFMTSIGGMAGTLSPQDASFAFNNNVNIQSLSAEEMASIEGEWLFLIPVITSAVSYAATSYAAGTFAWGGLAWAAGSGLMGGGLYGSIGRAARFAPWGFRGVGAGIGFGLNYSNPWINGW